MGLPFINPRVRHDHVCRPRSEPQDPSAFHRSLPSYSGPTPLVPLPSVAKRLGLGRVLVKVESSRLGLPSFKILGASWAIHSLLCQRLGLDPASTPFPKLRDRLSLTKDATVLYTATDGNHGRAVARMAGLLGLRAHVFVPSNVSPASRDLIASEGPDVHPVRGDYDAAVRLASEACSRSERGLLVQDTSWDGYEDVPMRIVHGYSTLFREIEDQLPPGHDGRRAPDLVVVPVGVGSLAHAAALHYRRPSSSSSSSSSSAGPSSGRPTLVSVEPVAAACLLESLRRGEPTTVETGETIMPGLCCGTVSPLAWPDLVSSISAAVAVEDQEVQRAMDVLRGQGGVDAGPCGAAPLAALEALSSSSEEGKEASGLGRDATVVLVCTEGAEVYCKSRASSV